MDPTPFLIMGAIFGSGGTLLIQAYGRRRVKKALNALHKQAAPSQDANHEERARRETAELARRLAVLEEIVTDRSSALAQQIEGLRREAI